MGPDHAAYAGEHGASAKQLATVSGHKMTKELDRDTAAADQPTLSRRPALHLPTRR
jgi:hypothetical protein